jgi:hypothetical protein
MEMRRIILIAFAFASVISPNWASALQDHGANHPQDSKHHTPQGVAPAAKPEFLIQAQKDLENAETELLAERKALEQLRLEEAKLRQSAIAKTGSWIEPTELWNKKQLLKQSIEIKQQAVVSAKRRLVRAENQAQSATESNWSHRHRPSWFRSWWQW